MVGTILVVAAVVVDAEDGEKREVRFFVFLLSIEVFSTFFHQFR